MKKKNWLALLMAGAMLAGALTGCGKKEEDNAGDGALKTVTEGKLTVAISPDFAPTVFVDPSREGQDQYVGPDVSLIRFIADELGLSPNTVKGYIRNVYQKSGSVDKQDLLDRVELFRDRL